MTRLLMTSGLLLMCAGCLSALEEQTKKDPNSIIGKTTQDIGEFDPAAVAVVSDGKIHATDPITAPLSAYGPMLESLSKIKVDPALNLYNAMEGHYPKTHEEFMTHIIKANNIQLPVLPGGKTYQYDVENHKLVVIDAPTNEPAAPSE